MVKAVSPGDEAEKRENDPDQVALESVDQDHQGSSSVHSFPQHIPLSIGHGPGPQPHGPGPAGSIGPILGHGASRGKSVYRILSIRLSRKFINKRLIRYSGT